LLAAVQVRSVLQLYVDIEHTSRNNAFYEKYNLRYSMGDLLSELHALRCILGITCEDVRSSACPILSFGARVASMIKSSSEA
jgi:hypothetical protein